MKVAPDDPLAARPVFRWRACGQTACGGRWSVPERMFQTGRSFDCGECVNCGEPGIAEVPADLARHYGSLHPAFVRSGRRPQEDCGRALIRGWPGPSRARIGSVFLTHDRVSRRCGRPRIAGASASR